MQQQPLSATVDARRRKMGFSWSDQAQLAANQARSVTPEQRRMLSKLHTLWSAGFLVFLSVQAAFVATPLAAGFQKSLVWAIALVPPVLAVLVVIPPLQRRSRLLRAADDGQIEHEQGEVVWDQKKSAYIARTPTRQLTTARSADALPPPGPYHFHYLTESAVLLSAQPIYSSTSALAYPGLLAAAGLPGNAQAVLALQQALCQAFGFDMDDLASNRQGLLSDKQRRQATQRVFRGTVGCILVLPVSLAMLAASIIYPLINPEAIALLEWGVLGLLLFVVALLEVTVDRRKREAEISAGAVQQVEGLIQPSSETGGSYDIGGWSFTVPNAAQQALVRDLHYRVYYLASLNLLLSLEPLEAPRH